jgi:L-lactate dehydrogenase
MAAVTTATAREIVVINRNAKRAEGLVADMQYGAVLAPSVRLRAGDYENLQGAAAVLLTAGVNERSGGATDRTDPAGRLRLLAANAQVVSQVVPRIAAAAPDAVLIVVTDPPDALAEVARPLAGRMNVVSTGTFLDSLRLRFHLARRCDVAPSDVDALVLGEHGTSQVFAWSGVRIGGVPLPQALPRISPAEREALKRDIEQEVRYANITIIEGIGASQLGIGVVAARLASAILKDEKRVLPVASHSETYGTTLSLPSVVGARGVERVLLPDLASDEQEALRRSADTIAKAVRHLSLA